MKGCGAEVNGPRALQMEEVRSIGSLPCLEHVALLNNPLSIIPDYRTKVLAQFGDRASEVSCWWGCGLVPADSMATVLCLSALVDSWPCRAFQFREALCLPRRRPPQPPAPPLSGLPPKPTGTG